MRVKYVSGEIVYINCRDNSFGSWNTSMDKAVGKEGTVKFDTTCTKRDQHVIVTVRGLPDYCYPHGCLTKLDEVSI